MPKIKKKTKSSNVLKFSFTETLSHDFVTDIEPFQATGRCVIQSFCFKTNTWNNAVIFTRYYKNEIVSLFLAVLKACLYSLLENSTITNFRKGNFYSNLTIGKGKGQALPTNQILSDIILFTYLFYTFFSITLIYIIFI